MRFSVLRCTQRLDKAGAFVPHSPENQISLEQDIIETMARDGLRTIGVAYRDIYPTQTDQRPSTEQVNK